MRPALIPAAALLAAFLSAPAQAAEPIHRACLNKAQQRAAVSSGQAVPLAQAISAVGGKTRRDTVRAQLCRTPKGLVYMLTLLGRGGKVTSAAVDASNGSVIGR
jgi:hypothetical protein